MKNKGRIGFITAGIAFLAGAVLALVLQIIGIANLDYEKVRFMAPGTEVIQLENGGRYILFHEYKSDYAGGSYSTRSVDIANLNIVVSDDRGKEIVPLAGNFHASYEFKNAGYSIRRYEIDGPAKVTFSTYYENGGPEIVLMLARNFAGAIIRRIFTILISFFGMTAIGIMLILIPYIKRRKASNQPEPVE